MQCDSGRGLHPLCWQVWLDTGPEISVLQPAEARSVLTVLENFGLAMVCVTSGLAGLFVVRLCWLPGELTVEDWRSCRGFRGGGYPICKAWLDVSSIQWSLWNSLCLVLSVSRPWSLQQGYRWLEELLSVWLHLIMWNNLKPECFIEISWSIDNIWDYQVWKRAEMCDIW